MRISKYILITCVVTVISQRSVSADLVLYNSQSSFFANARIASTETFGEFPSNTYFYTQAIGINGVSYATDQTAAGNGFPGNSLWEIGGGFGSQGYVSYPNSLSANFIGTDTIGFGKNEYVNDFGFHMLSAATYPQVYNISVTEIDGSTSSFSVSSGQPYVYVGFTSAIGIQGLTIANAPNSAIYNFGFDNVSHSDFFSVPEPTSLATLSIGLATLLGYLSMRRRNARCAEIHICGSD